MESNSFKLFSSSESNPTQDDNKKFESYEIDADSSSDELLTRRSSCGSYSSSSSNADNDYNDSTILDNATVRADEPSSRIVAAQNQHANNSHCSVLAQESEALPQQRQQQQSDYISYQTMQQQVDDVFHQPPSRAIPQNHNHATTAITTPPSLFGSARKFEASHELSQTQNTEILTQNPDLTQLVDDLGENSNLLSPPPPSSPGALRCVPWGRLLPCSASQLRTDLLPRDPSSTTASQRIDTATGGISLFGLHNIYPSDIFNEYTVGRSKNCDLTICEPLYTAPMSSKQKARKELAYGLISNRHCRIYCSLRSNAGALSGGIEIDVYIEDCSGNGTVINKTTLLRKGEKRILHSGDEISLVNARSLREKFSSDLDDILQQFSFIFVNCIGDSMINTPSNPRSFLTAVTGLSGHGITESSHSKKRKAAVDVRSTKHPRVHQYTQSQMQDAIDDESRQVFGSQKSDTTNQQGLLNHNEDCTAPTESLQKLLDQQRIFSMRRIQEDYDIRDLLGSGTVGIVHRAIHRKTGQERAVKIIQLSRNRSNFAAMTKNDAFTGVAAAEQFQVEAKILQGLEHPYIVRLIDVYVTPGVAVFLVMELVSGGDLFDRIVEKGRYSETESRRVMRRLLSAIFYLHEEKNIVHRDLKPENILCTSHKNDVEVKITDFGLAKSVSGNEDGLKTFCGTPQYFAPEVLKRRHTITGCGRYGKQADMWSVGVILYVLLSGTPPFDAGVDTVAYGNQIDFPDEFWHDVSSDAKDLVLKLLVMEPKHRYTVKDACEHKWILTADGDTHIHPLDDPQFVQPKTKVLVKASTLKAKASMLTENIENANQSTEKASILNDNKTKIERNLSDSMSCDYFQNEDGPKIDEVASNSDDEVENQIHCTVRDIRNTMDKQLESPINRGKNSEEPSSENMASPNPPTEVSSKSVRINEERRPLSPVFMNETGPDTNVKRTKDGSMFEISSPLKPETSAKSETSVKSDVLLRSALKSNSNKTWRRPIFSCLATTVTPGVSNKSVMNPPDETIIKRQLISSLELSDDEVFSQFSEQTESISSFSTAIPLVHGSDGEEEATSMHQSSSRLDESAPATCTKVATQLEKGHADPSSSKNYKKPRGPNKGVSTNRRATVKKSKTQQKSQKQSKTNNIKVKKSAAGPDCEGERKNVNQPTGGKQTTLSSWFKSH